MRTFIQKKQILDIRKNPGLPLQKETISLCRNLSFSSPALLKEYHDALLFVQTFPADKESVDMAVSEMNRVAAFIGQAQGVRWQYALTGSGLPGTEITCQYTRILLRWLLDTYPEAVQPAESTASPEEVKAFFQAILPGIEFNQATARSLSLWKRIQVLTGHYFNRAAMEWLIELTDHTRIPAVLKDQLFDGLKIFANWKIMEEGMNRSFLRGPAGKTAYYTSGKKFQVKALIRKPVRKLVPGREERIRLITIARASLAFYCRETDPFTYASAEATNFFELGDGFRIALYGMTKDRRFSLDSYIGFLAFKNGLPVAYGGGWVFGYRCKIGVNIYPPYRGADSAYLFTQVLRVYYQQFRVHYFLVKPYQFGRGNPEGIRTGAFWFYYKLGFRSASPAIDGLAGKEWEKIKSGNGYRSSPALLQKMTAAPLILVLNKEGINDPRATELSERVTSLIREKYAGNRFRALEAATRNWLKMGRTGQSAYKKMNTAAWQDWQLLFLLLAGIKPRKAVWEKLTRLRFTGTETAFIRCWQENRHLWAGTLPATGS